MKLEKEIFKILIEDRANNKTERETAKTICDLFDVSNLLLCGMCDKETKHEQIS